MDKLWIVTVISNPERYRSRYEHFKKLKVACERAGANLMVVEAAFGDRPHECDRVVEFKHEAHNHHHLKLRTSSEIWHKENMINLGVQRLPDDWKHVAWIDADIEFMRQDWLEEIVHKLQHYHVIQLFSHAVDLGPMGEPLQTHKGFVYSWENELPSHAAKRKYQVWHPGYAWAMRRETWDDLGGLFDTAILGAADNHMAWSFVGEVLDSVPTSLTPAYHQALEIWQDRATKHVRQNIGYMPGMIFHHFHGKKKDRRYADRWKLLIKHSFDMNRDLKRDWQGLWQLSDEGLRMRNDLRRYFQQRNEDSIDP